MPRQTHRPVRGRGDKSEAVIFSLCPSCLHCAVLCRSRLGQRAVLAASPGPPAVEDMFSVCLTQCIFNELRLSSVFGSVGLNDADKESYRLHIVLARGSINNNVAKAIMGACVQRIFFLFFLHLMQEVVITKAGFKEGSFRLTAFLLLHQINLAFSQLSL